MTGQTTDPQAWVALNRIPGIGRVRYQLLEKRFGRLESAWSAPAGELRAAGLDERATAAIVAQRPSVSPEAEMERLARQGVRAITWNDDAYPPRLKEIFDLPPVLYVRGALTRADEWAVAVVGTRRPTPSGRQGAEPVS